MARRHVTVALNGDGGDEAFLGYSRYRAMHYLDRLDRAEKFGYRIPDPPAFLYAQPCRPCGR